MEFGAYTRSGKMIVMCSLLKLWKEQNHKVLLFSQSRQMLSIIENFIISEGYNYLRMDGTTSISKRQNIIDNFNNVWLLNNCFNYFFLGFKHFFIFINNTRWWSRS